MDEGGVKLEGSTAEENGSGETAEVMSSTMDDEEDDCFQDVWSGADDSNNCDADGDVDDMDEDDSLFGDDDYEEDIEMDSSLDVSSNKKEGGGDEESIPFEILSPEQLVQCMASSIQQVRIKDN